ncbi:ubiquitin domain-containing protein [Aspergillus thermomutatus]|uniref:Ubiquitin-like domain-containing protein n=1 Tax=Aspergillus thermomutatus TaxID=41047 RepID=A0A397GA66_ASPTH|nr:uncharacterized protein CDV56_102042 [Aspergillus thermomutatus]RHZ44990.1 hypothetical protein CDV56_102042 [Aspergillus thermomutatus]
MAVSFHHLQGSCLSFLSRDNGDPSHATQVVTEERRADTSSNALRSTTNAIVSSCPSTSLTRTTSRADRHIDRRTPATTITRLALSEHFNAPIRPHVWYSKRRTWSRAQLDQERKEFFETRVTGRAEVWAALAAAISFMHANDLATAQSIIDAAGVTVPTGDLCQGCYDEQGALYRLPRCIVSDPENMVPEDSASRRDDGYDDFDTDDSKLSLDEASGDELIGGDSADRRDEKGKMSERDLIRVTARLSDGSESDVVVSVGKNQTVGLIARRVQQEAGIPATQRVRIVYLGRMLNENTPLVDQGWKAGNIINALVVARPSAS